MLTHGDTEVKLCIKRQRADSRTCQHYVSGEENTPTAIHSPDDVSLEIPKPALISVAKVSNEVWKS